MNLNLGADEKETISELMARLASSGFGTPQDFFRKLLLTSFLPAGLTSQVTGQLSGDAEFDAIRLIEFAIGRKALPDARDTSVLGAILKGLLRQPLSPDDARNVVAVIVTRGLLDTGALRDLSLRYRVPVPAVDAAGPNASAANYGPEIHWQGPDDLELQGQVSTPKWLDVGYLRRAMERASGVCLVQTGSQRGTGFLIRPTLALTNFHVLKTNSEELADSARKAKLRFGVFEMAGSEPEKGREFALDASQPFVDQSPVEELDFVLMRVEERITDYDAIQPAPLSGAVPDRGSALNILHHPNADTMKLSLSTNGVAGVFEKRLVQYATAAAEGSSGSPCFDDNWEAVALHHAQRARAFGSIREGILMPAIRERIAKYL